MKVIIGSARRDENGKYAGGKPGDQDGVEVSTQNYYVHTKGWYMFRFLSDEHAKKVAKAMWDACMNNNIGYCQAHRSIMAMLKKYGNMKAIGEKTETDCSDLVRGCIYEATGIDVGAFSTATEPSVLEKSGLFAKKVSVTSATVLKSGDILVTKSKGHTVIVVSVADPPQVEAHQHPNRQCLAVQQRLRVQEVKMQQSPESTKRPAISI